MSVVRAENLGFGNANGQEAFNREVLRRDVIPKRQKFIARTGKVYAPDTTDGAFSAFLPKLAHDGAWVGFRDVTGMWGISNFTLDGVINSIRLGPTTGVTQLIATANIDVILTWDRRNRVWNGQIFGASANATTRYLSNLIFD